MSLSPNSTSQKIQKRLKEVHSLVHKIENARGKSESDLDQIEKIQNEMKVEGKLNSVEKRKLKMIYNKTVDDSKKEEKVLREALDKIQEIKTMKNEIRLQARSAGNKEAIRRGTLMKMLLTSAQTLPLYVGKTLGEKIPQLCGAVPAESSYVAKVGDMVAAFIKDANNEENWILAEVVSYNDETNKYEVDDVDEEEKVRYIVSRRQIVPLPLMRANPETDKQALYPKGAIVMALYPQTTCFYKAIIHSVPTTARDDYEIIFEEDSLNNRYSQPLNVPQRYVVSIKENRKRIKVNRK